MKVDTQAIRHMQMFNEKEMVSFGNYLLSDFRKKLIEDHPGNSTLPTVEDRISKVTHADIANWMEWNTDNLTIESLSNT